MDTRLFQEIIWEKGNELYREMPWRLDTRPYYVLVSEIMLQQTQVDRVIPKFTAFIERFPDIATLATAPLADVLTLWSGLGYNRRAKFLHEAAKMIVLDFEGTFPEDPKEMQRLPGVGVNTAGAIAAYSFNQPVVYIETNVRTVYFHHFFHDNASITDTELRELVRETMDTEHPRQWYWAIMDYGAWLKKQGAGRNEKSAHYKKQSPLKGSVREIRGLILKVLSAGPVKESVLPSLVPFDDRFQPALDGLIRDGLVSTRQGTLHLSE